jgi:pseudaminic acid cytidylyltransferase
LTTLAIIPARGGSKRIPRKNIKPFLGVPMLARTIAVLRESRAFDRIVVSTDDDEIAAIATDAGAEAPFRRPAGISGDRATTAAVIEHAVTAVEAGGFRAEYVCCAYPAAVLARSADIRQACEILQQSAFDYVFTATAYPYPIQRALRKAADGGCTLFWPENVDTPSQELEPAFHDAGQF